MIAKAQSTTTIIFSISSSFEKKIQKTNKKQTFLFPHDLCQAPSSSFPKTTRWTYRWKAPGLLHAHQQLDRPRLVRRARELGANGSRFGEKDVELGGLWGRRKRQKLFSEIAETMALICFDTFGAVFIFALF